MPTRRDLLCQGWKAAAAVTLCHVSSPLLLAAQQNTAPHRQTDEMTVNSAPQPAHYPPPDFGPPITELPPETKALAGRNSLREHAHRRGLIAGAAVVVHLLTQDTVLQQLIGEQYGILVPESELKWVALRPSVTEFNFDAGDALFRFAHEHKMLVRGHTLVWHNSVPHWLERDAKSLNVRNLLVQHIRTVMSRYRGRVHSWDVVNEAILPKDGQPMGLRKSFWYDAVGPDYIELAYRTAREADPYAKLTYNDYGVETDSADDEERRKLILALLRDMQQRKIPLDAVGIQSHIKAAQPSTIGNGLRNYIAAIRDMGLEVYLTELDVNEDDIATNDIAARDTEIASTYSHFLDLALADPAVKLLLTWGVSDRRTWLNDGPTHHRKQPNRPQRSLPFDPYYKPAPAFFALRDSLDKAPVRTPSTPKRRVEKA